MTAKSFGCVGITDERGQLAGIITDGDLRRHMSPNLLELKVETVMTRRPETVRPDQLVSEALELLNTLQKNCTDRGRAGQAGRRRALPRPAARGRSLTA